MCRGEAPSCDDCTPLKAVTGKQRLALALKKGDKTDQEIADLMGITRESANRLVNRGRRAEKAYRAFVVDFIGNP